MSNAINPRLYNIPSKQVRTALLEGDRAKLCFLLDHPLTFEPIKGLLFEVFEERVWVRVTTLMEDGSYVGVIETDPLTRRFLRLGAGDPVWFASIHVLDVD